MFFVFVTDETGYAMQGLFKCDWRALLEADFHNEVEDIKGGAAACITVEDAAGGMGRGIVVVIEFIGVFL